MADGDVKTPGQPWAGRLATGAAALDPVAKIVGPLVAFVGLYVGVASQGPLQVAAFVAVCIAIGWLIWRIATDKNKEFARPDVPAIRGLIAFNESDAERFFGREDEVRKLLGTLQGGARVCLVTGEPSTGKTSLLRAGVMPRLQPNVWLPIFVSEPSADPLGAVRDAVVRAGSLSRPDRPLIELIRACATKTSRTPVIIVDQLERLFVSDALRQANAALLEAVGECVRLQDLPVRFVFCTRNGYDQGLQGIREAVGEPIPNQAHVDMHRFEREEAEQILTRMAEHDHTPMNPTLRSAIVHNLIRSGSVCPAELQLVSMWVRDENIRTLPRYEGIGRAEGLFRKYVRNVLGTLDTTSVGAARHVLRVLADRASSPADGAMTRDAILDAYGGATRAAGTLEMEAIDRALRGLVVDGIVAQVVHDSYQLVHAYFAEDIRIALGGPEPQHLRIWWRVRQTATEYGLASTLILVALLAATGLLLRFFGAPAAPPVWALTAREAVSSASLTAFGPGSSHLAVDNGAQLAVWDITPSPMLAFGLWSREPLLTLPRSPKPVDGEAAFVPNSVGFLSDGTEMYRVSLRGNARWRIDHIRLSDRQLLPQLEGDLSPPVTTTPCSPQAAAYSRDLDTVAVAYGCGPIVLSRANGAGHVPRIAYADQLERCRPSRIALGSLERRLAAIYTCVDKEGTQSSQYRNWNVDPALSKPELVPTAVDLSFANDSPISALMFGPEGHVAVGVDKGGSIALHDVSLPEAPVLVQASGNAANPQHLWISPDGRHLAELDGAAPTRIQVRSVDLWLGPIRVPPIVLVGHARPPMRVLLSHES